MGDRKLPRPILAEHEYSLAILEALNSIDGTMLAILKELKKGSAKTAPLTAKKKGK